MHARTHARTHEQRQTDRQTDRVRGDRAEREKVKCREGTSVQRQWRWTLEKQAATYCSIEKLFAGKSNSITCEVWTCSTWDKTKYFPTEKLCTLHLNHCRPVQRDYVFAGMLHVFPRPIYHIWLIPIVHKFSCGAKISKWKARCMSACLWVQSWSLGSWWH